MAKRGNKPARQRQHAVEDRSREGTKAVERECLSVFAGPFSRVSIFWDSATLRRLYSSWHRDIIGGQMLYDELVARRNATPSAEQE